MKTELEIISLLTDLHWEAVLQKLNEFLPELTKQDIMTILGISAIASLGIGILTAELRFLIPKLSLFKENDLFQLMVNMPSEFLVLFITGVILCLAMYSGVESKMTIIQPIALTLFLTTALHTLRYNSLLLNTSTDESSSNFD